MAKLIHNRIKIAIGRYNFNFELKSPIVVINGNSGIGKTLFYSKFNDYCIANNINDYTFINYSMPPSSVDALLNIGNKIVIVDNADVVLNKTQDYYSDPNNSNQYIIFGRLIANYTLDTKNVATIVEDKKAEFRLWYPDLRWR